MEYKGTLEDGTIFDSSEKLGHPLVFILGSSEVLPAFQEAVVGMVPGEKKTLRLSAKEAYGDPRPELVQVIDREHFPDDQELEPGLPLLVQLQDGVRLPATILEVKEDTITLDFNPPLAGKPLKFWIKLVAVDERE